MAIFQVAIFDWKLQTNNVVYWWMMQVCIILVCRFYHGLLSADFCRLVCSSDTGLASRSIGGSSRLRSKNHVLRKIKTRIKGSLLCKSELEIVTFPAFSRSILARIWSYWKPLKRWRKRNTQRLRNWHLHGLCTKAPYLSRAPNEGLTWNKISLLHPSC